MEDINARAGSPPETDASGSDGPGGDGSFLGWVEEVRLNQSTDPASPGSQGPGGGRRLGRPWLLLAVPAIGLAGALVALGLGVAAERSPAPQTLLRGRVVDPQGKPRHGAVVTLETAPGLFVRTAADGSFRLAGAPSGSRDLLVAVGIVAQEYHVEIRDGGVTEIGTLCYAAPQDR